MSYIRKDCEGNVGLEPKKMKRKLPKAGQGRYEGMQIVVTASKEKRKKDIRKVFYKTTHTIQPIG